MNRARNAVGAWEIMIFRTAFMKRGDRLEEVLVELLAVDEIVVVKPGERVPVDGIITAGGNSIDQSAITGESALSTLLLPGGDRVHRSSRLGVNTPLSAPAGSDPLNSMKTPIGLWIDHRRAVVVGVAGVGEDILEIRSHADRQPGRTDGVASTHGHASQGSQADDVLDRKFSHQLNAYYDKVIALVEKAPSLLIFGPGEAKGEFRKRLEHESPSARHVRVETADKMTDAQVAAKVDSYFSQEARGGVFS